MTIRFGLLGAGRIGQTHGRAVASINGAELASVFDPFDKAVKSIVKQYGAKRASVDEIMADPNIDAVLICTPTDLHADQIEQAAKAGKAIFCEKPIDLSTKRVEQCLKTVKKYKAKLMLGFNRRFDPNFLDMQKRINRKAVGEVELVQITSRDPAPPPIDYIKRSGGIFRDMMIHDFDMARFMLGEEIATVSASGSVLVDKAIGKAGDFDTASATLTTKSGKIAVITCSRRASYGYDQRVEVHGSKGMLSAENMRPTTVTFADNKGYRQDPLLDFFMERYADAYRIELESFIASLTRGKAISPNGEDGLWALRIADAALASAKTAKTIKL